MSFFSYITVQDYSTSNRQERKSNHFLVSFTSPLNCRVEITYVTSNESKKYT